MALNPKNYDTKEILQPGSRGEKVKVNMPGYRNNDDYMMRTNTKLNVNAHDVPNIKYLLDNRLKPLFRYGYAFGYNQIVIPKGRIVAIDPSMNQTDFDVQKQYNVLTLANGGINVELDADGKTWKQTAETLTVDPATGLCAKDGVASKQYRFANKPIGIIERNEYTRNDDAHNGMSVGPVLTDAMVELPWFATQTQAEENPWGSVYGSLQPGDYVKSDLNGRFVKSKLSDSSWLATASIAEYEHERQQTIGQVYEANKELIPAGAAKYAQWALSDILNFEGFNPDTYRATNRDGEDNINNSPYNSQGKYPGYPYEKAFMDSDLHMLESYRKTYDQRMQLEYRYDLGIPGLTDGYNAISRTVTDASVGSFGSRGDCDEYVDVYVKTNDCVNISNISIALGETAMTPATVGATLTATIDSTTGNIAKVKYCNETQGIVVLSIDKTAADAFFNTVGGDVKVNIALQYTKRGEAGVPTFLDWDGCMGTVKILLQK